MKIETVNPTTEALLKTYPILNKTQIRTQIDEGYTSWQAWKQISFAKRQQLFLKLADILLQQKEELAKLMATEMGKPLSQGSAEIEKCAWVCKHFAEQAEHYLKEQIIKTDMQKTMVCYTPLGIVFGIMPWNFPFWQVFRFAAPTIMAGNAVILKHAPISTGSGEKIAHLFLEAGFPKHLFQHFALDNDLAAEVISDKKIAAITLTGSNRAGSQVAALAAKHVKKTVLELGGNDPFIVLEDANLDWAAECIVKSRLNNCGQVCIAAKRIIVVESVQQSLQDKILVLMKTYKMGDPLDEKTNIGPMARSDLRQTLQKQVQSSISLGAKLVIGGVIPEGKGFYYPPTILTEVKKGMPAFDEELFGPVIAIITAQNEKDAILLANQSQYGLGAAVFTEDLKKGERIAHYEVEAGVCFVNAIVASDPRVPFGGIKESGYGRELSREGILEFVNTKTVAIR